MIKSLELHVNYKCTLRCKNCCNLVGQLPDIEERYNMKPEQLQKALDECEQAGIHWDVLRFHGGEPTLHPQIELLSQICLDYKKKHPATLIEIMSNGYKNEAILKRLKDMGIHLGIAPKDPNSTIPYVTVNVAPIEHGRPYITTGCFLHTNCGVALNCFGFFACSPMAAAYRIGITPEPIKNGGEVSQEVFNAQMASYCGYCGFSDPEKDERRSNAQETSPFWEKALKNPLR